MWYQWKFQLKPEDRLWSQTRVDEEATWLGRSSELGRGITDLISSLGASHGWGMNNSGLQDIGSWCRAFPDGSVQSFPAIDRSAMTLQFWCSLFHCILSLLFLLRVLNIFTSMLYHCYAHKYILYMTLKCVHNILLSEKSGFPNWCMPYLTDSDFMSWCRNYEKGTMFWSCFVDDTHIHTQPQFPYL